MKFELSRRKLLGLIASLPALYVSRSLALTRQTGEYRGGGGKRYRRSDYRLPESLAEFGALSLILGRVTNHSVTVSAISREAGEGFIEFGTKPGLFSHRTEAFKWLPNKPFETLVPKLQPNTQYFYRLKSKQKSGQYLVRAEGRFHTQRSPGSKFSFGIQGDSHPERPQMSSPDLYATTLIKASEEPGDFYICMGDDFSIDTLDEITEESVASRYMLQRPFLGLVGRSSPIFLLNGNHEQASLFNFNQTDDRHQAAIFAQKSRNSIFPTISPDDFYTGNEEAVSEIGQLKDYYSWTWGDALFIVLDNYWHSTTEVDSGLHEKNGGAGGGGNGGGGGGHGGRGGGRGKGGQGGKNRDLWDVTIGDAQYQWLAKTLAASKSKFKFVFAHHVLGTQRGGVDVSHLYEWGGYNKNGDYDFPFKRPKWQMPIHQLMVKHKVTIFFQGHDHLYCQQEKDGLIYQEVPMPADHGYSTYNEDRYQSGVKLPNSGHLRVTVSPQQVQVDYVRSYLAADETNQKKTGEITHSYIVKTKDLSV